MRSVKDGRNSLRSLASPAALCRHGSLKPTPSAPIEKVRIRTEGHDHVPIVLIDQRPALLVMKTGEAAIACRRKGLSTGLAGGKNRIYPCALHDKVQLAELTPDPVRLRPVSCIGTHDCLPELVGRCARSVGCNSLHDDVPVGRIRAFFSQTESSDIAQMRTGKKLEQRELRSSERPPLQRKVLLKGCFCLI